MKRSLFIAAILCSAAVFTLPSCKEETVPGRSASRAPQLVRQSAEKAPVHPDILALGQEMKQGKDHYDAVRRRMFALPRELSVNDANAFLDLLLAPPADNWTELSWAAIVNDGLNILREGKKQPEGLMARLLELHRDTARPAVLRDYALQHFGTQLAACYRDPAGRGKALCPDEDVRRQAEEALRAAMTPATGAIAGTACNVTDAIIAACRASGATPPISLEELDQTCRNTALTPEGNLHARISALGMLARHRNPAALKEARGWMMDVAQPALLRAAAISYTGRFALEADRVAFHTLAADTDLRLSLPAREGLKRLTPPQ